MRTTTLIATLALAGCSSTGVIPMDGDSYMIAKKDGTPGLGVSYSNKAKVYQEAGEFCKARGLVVKTLEVNTTAARPGQLGGTELQFRCVQQGTQGEAAPQRPDQVIEERRK